MPVTSVKLGVGRSRTAGRDGADAWPGAVGGTNLGWRSGFATQHSEDSRGLEAYLGSQLCLSQISAIKLISLLLVGVPVWN